MRAADAMLLLAAGCHEPTGTPPPCARAVLPGQLHHPARHRRRPRAAHHPGPADRGGWAAVPAGRAGEDGRAGPRVPAALRPGHRPRHRHPPGQRHRPDRRQSWVARLGGAGACLPSGAGVLATRPLALPRPCPPVWHGQRRSAAAPGARHDGAAVASPRAGITGAACRSADGAACGVLLQSPPSWRCWWQRSADWLST